MPRAKPKLQIFKLLLLAAVLSVVFAGSPAGAERLRIIPVPPHVTAQWTPMPEVPQVFFAPNLPTDVFRHRGRYYFFWEGVWYRSKNVKGPWNRLEPPPAILSQIPPSYFKTLPQAGAQPPAGMQPPAAAAPGQTPTGEVLLTPDGKLATPPAAPTAPTPPAGAYAPEPAEPAPVTPPQPPAAAQPQAPEATTPQPPAAPAQPPEKEESAPLAVPEGPMPKAM
ncbi:MAG: hypothetical protein ACYDIC_17875 [Desulfobaccales bacterium]